MVSGSGPLGQTFTTGETYEQAKKDNKYAALGYVVEADTSGGHAGMALYRYAGPEWTEQQRGAREYATKQGYQRDPTQSQEQAKAEYLERSTAQWKDPGAYRGAYEQATGKKPGEKQVFLATDPGIRQQLREKGQAEYYEVDGKYYPDREAADTAAVMTGQSPRIVEQPDFQKYREYRQRKTLEGVGGSFGPREPWDRLINGHAVTPSPEAPDQKRYFRTRPGDLFLSGAFKASRGFSQASDTAFRNLIGDSPPAKVARGAASVITGLPELATATAGGLELFAREPVAYARSMPAALGLFGEKTAKAIKEDPLFMAGAVGGMVVAGKAGAVARGAKGAALKARETAGRVTWKDLIIQKEPVAWIEPTGKGMKDIVALSKKQNLLSQAAKDRANMQRIVEGAKDQSWTQAARPRYTIKQEMKKAGYYKKTSSDPLTSIAGARFIRGGHVQKTTAATAGTIAALGLSSGKAKAQPSEATLDAAFQASKKATGTFNDIIGVREPHSPVKVTIKGGASQAKAVQKEIMKNLGLEGQVDNLAIDARGTIVQKPKKFSEQGKPDPLVEIDYFNKPKTEARLKHKKNVDIFGDEQPGIYTWPKLKKSRSAAIRAHNTLVGEGREVLERSPVPVQIHNLLVASKPGPKKIRLPGFAGSKAYRARAAHNTLTREGSQPGFMTIQRTPEEYNQLVASTAPRKSLKTPTKASVAVSKMFGQPVGTKHNILVGEGQQPGFLAIRRTPEEYNQLVAGKQKDGIKASKYVNLEDMLLVRPAGRSVTMSAIRNLPSSRISAQARSRLGKSNVWKRVRKEGSLEKVVGKTAALTSMATIHAARLGAKTQSRTRVAEITGVRQDAVLKEMLQNTQANMLKVGQKTRVTQQEGQRIRTSTKQGTKRAPLMAKLPKFMQLPKTRSLEPRLSAERKTHGVEWINPLRDPFETPRVKRSGFNQLLGSPPRRSAPSRGKKGKKDPLDELLEGF